MNNYLECDHKLKSIFEVLDCRLYAIEVLTRSPFDEDMLQWSIFSG